MRAAGGFSFAPRFPVSKVEYWAARYDRSQDSVLENEIAPRIRAIGYLNKRDFLLLAHWKSPRSQRLCVQNPEDYIKAVTQTALSTPNERLRIEALTLLKGVGWPTASVVLHFGHKDRYPILDFRSLWSLRINLGPESYDFALWQAYFQSCRRLAAQARVTMRILDRALWQFSKENQD